MALEYFDRAYKIRLSLMGEDHPKTIEVKESIEATKAKQANHKN